MCVFLTRKDCSRAGLARPMRSPCAVAMKTRPIFQRSSSAGPAFPHQNIGATEGKFCNPIAECHIVPGYRTKQGRTPAEQSDIVYEFFTHTVRSAKGPDQFQRKHIFLIIENHRKQLVLAVVVRRLHSGYFRFLTRIETQRSGFDSERRSKGAGG